LDTDILVHRNLPADLDFNHHEEKFPPFSHTSFHKI
jgi:hypothetical protein